jgi:hypothetical protein
LDSLNILLKAASLNGGRFFLYQQPNLSDFQPQDDLITILFHAKIEWIITSQLG